MSYQSLKNLRVHTIHYAISFAVKATVPVYFNCGGTHTLKECPTPKDDQRIKINRKKFWDSKKGSKDKKGKANNAASPAAAKPGKWSRPTSEEKKNRSRRNIDGKDYYYHYKDKHWKLVNTTQANVGTPAAHVVAATAPAAVASPNVASDQARGA